MRDRKREKSRMKRLKKKGGQGRKDLGMKYKKGGEKDWRARLED